MFALIYFYLFPSWGLPTILNVFMLQICLFLDWLTFSSSFFTVFRLALKSTDSLTFDPSRAPSMASADTLTLFRFGLFILPFSSKIFCERFWIYCSQGNTHNQPSKCLQTTKDVLRRLHTLVQIKMSSSGKHLGTPEQSMKCTQTGFCVLKTLIVFYYIIFWNWSIYILLSTR